MKETYIIGEIGQNHNGSVDIAKLIVELIARPIKEEVFNLDLKPMNAVKMTKRDLSEELTTSQMNRIYDTPNSFGRTYGEHRAFLELTDEEHFEVYKYAKSLGLDFVETLCAVGCLSLLKLFTPDYLKVASRDLTNLPLLQRLAETKIPIILSTGMAGTKELDEALDVITRYHSNISILHCVSQYPTYPDNLNLKTITYLKKHYGQYKIGFSDHTIGIAAPIVAVGMGAEIIEKHFTLDQNMDGPDHKASLNPIQLKHMITAIRNIEEALGDGIKQPNKSEQEISKVVLKRIVANCHIHKGDIFTEKNLTVKRSSDGIKANLWDTIIGNQALYDFNTDEPIKIK